MRDDRQTTLSVSLTAREKEILTWIRDGKSTGEISTVLDISQDTVKYHVKNIFQKLNATSRTQAIAMGRLGMKKLIHIRTSRNPLKLLRMLPKPT